MADKPKHETKRENHEVTDDNRPWLRCAEDGRFLLSAVGVYD